MTAQRAADFPLLEDIQVALVVHDATGQAVASNAQALALLGLTPEELAGRAPLPAGWALLDAKGEALPAPAHPVARVLATRAPVHDVAVGIRRPRQGDVTWALVHAGPHLDARGQVERVLVSWVDVTARRAAEQALADSEARYRALFDSMDAAVFLMRGPTCLACNPAGAKLFGLTRPEDLIGKTPLDFAPEKQPDGRNSAEWVQENVRLALERGTHRFEWVTTRADGSPMTLDVRFTSFRAGGEDLFLCIGLDITDRRQAEVALTQSEARFRAIIERAAEGVMLADVETKRVRYANPEVCRLLGYTQEELQRLSVDDLHPPDALPRVHTEFERQARGLLRDAHLPCLRKDGSTLQVRVRGVPVDLDGRRCLVGFFHDTTTERLLEEERLRAQKLEAIGVLAGGIAHDFNNLLQSAFGFLAVAKQAGAPAHALAALADAEAALRLASALTGQLLTFSRGGQPVKRPLALGPLLQGVARFALSGSRARFDVDAAPQLWAVEADEGQLSQVIQNIVLNADQAMPDGGTVTVSARNVEAPAPGAPAHLAPGRYVAVSVRDTGPGVAPEIRSRIFDPYFTTRADGSGLGLAVSYSVVKNHGGAIDVQSAPGQGSTFTVFLPATAGAAPPPLQPAPASATRAARILVMDDDPLVRKAVGLLLQSLGHTVALAEEGAAAVAQFEAARAAGAPFDLVLLDLTVRGGLGGVETLTRLKALDPAVKAIVCSGYSEEPAVADFRRYGFSAALQKPYTTAELQQALSALGR